MAMPGTPPFSSSVPLTYTFLSIQGVSLAFGFLWSAAMARRRPFLAQFLAQPVWSGPRTLMHETGIAFAG